VPELLLKAVIGACDEMLTALRTAYVYPVPRSDMTVRGGFNPVGARGRARCALGSSCHSSRRRSKCVAGRGDPAHVGLAASKGWERPEQSLAAQADG